MKDQKTRFIIFLTLIFILSFSGANAKVYIDIGLPTQKVLPIAIPGIQSAEGESAVMASKITDVITRDLNTSGILNILDKSKYPVDSFKGELNAEAINFKPWLAIGAEIIMKGKLVMDGKNVTVDARLYDAAAGKQLMISICEREAKEYRKISHEIADNIILNLTGEKGIFTTKMAFVSNVKGNKEIYVMDYDGEEIEAVTKNGSINLSPAWAPDGSAISFVSYKDGRPAVYLTEPTSGKETKLKVPEGTAMGASWSPEGSRLAIVVSKDGNADIYSINRDGTSLARLTDNWGLDVSPSWAPGGKEMAFVSDRGGSPQVYLMDSSGGNVRRLTFEGAYNASPSWSPKGDRIAFAGANDGRFDIFTINPDGSDLRQLTGNSGNNENPSWSPDGGFISFSSTREGGSNIYIMRSDGSGQKKISTAKGKAFSPTWGPRKIEH